MAATMKYRPIRFTSNLKDLVKVEKNGFRRTGAGANRDNRIQPFISLIAGFESRCRSDVIFGRIRGIALEKSRQHIRRTTPKPLVTDIDQGAIVGSQRVPGFQVNRPIPADDLP